MNETYFVVKKSIDGCYLLNKPNKIIFSSKNLKEASLAFSNIAGNSKVYPDEFNKGIYILLSIGHYPSHPRALRVIDSNTFPV